MDMMRAIMIEKDEAGYRAALGDVEVDRLPRGDVLVQVGYSTLNYKDSLAITGKGPVVRKFPMIPGIDLTGQVMQSSHPDFRPGDQVLLNGFGLGESHWGAFADLARVNGDWLIPQPYGFSPRQSMAVGTAGYTAMLCVMALEENGVTPASGEVLVTGAAGGVGSVAVALLANLGYEITASTGRVAELTEYLKALGAHNLIDRRELSQPGKPLQKERWAAAIDVAGSHTLANVCASVRYGGTVAACGLAQGADLPLSVMPFILRGITLKGVDSVYCPRPRRLAAWSRLSHDLEMNKLEAMTNEIQLRDVIDAAKQQINGQIRGRMVININGDVQSGE